MGRDAGRHYSRIARKGAEAFRGPATMRPRSPRAFTGARAAYAILPPCTPRRARATGDAIAKGVKVTACATPCATSSYGARSRGVQGQSPDCILPSKD